MSPPVFDHRRAALLLFVLAPLTAFGQGSLSVTFTTTGHGGKYAPRNAVAVWVEGPSGFVKTIGRWAQNHRNSLKAWTATAGANDTDAVSAASRPNHDDTLTVSWDLKNKSGVVVPDGTYTIRMELADSNATSASQNAQGTFTFVKGPTSSKQTTSGGGFTNVTITYTAANSGAGGGGGSSGTGGGSAGTGGGSAGTGGGRSGTGGGSSGTGGGRSGTGGGSSGTGGGRSGTGGGSSGAGGGTGGALGTGGGRAPSPADGGTDDSTMGGCSATGGWGLTAAGWALLALAGRRRKRNE